MKSKSQNLTSGALASASLFLSAVGFRTALAGTVLAIGWLANSQASATSFSAFYSFGDSTIDSGWWAGALNGQCDGVTPPCATGSAGKNGLIADGIANGGTGAPVGVGLMRSQIIAAHYGRTAIPANQPMGTNYAISGALSVAVGGDGNLNPNPNLPSASTQIANYLGANFNLANPSALYLASAGGNDITYARENFATPAERQTFLANQAAAYATAIHVLQMAGAHTIVVDGVGGSGALATFWNTTLVSDLSALNVKFIFADIASVVQDVQNNPTLYGFTAATVLPGIVGTGTGSACVTQTGAAATTSGWGQWCANSTASSSTHAYLRSANSEMTSFYSDDQHFSAAGQLIVANYEIALIDRLATPLPAALPLFATGLGALGLLGWRRKRQTLAAH
jgi:outer membrane lipase/esterase